MEITKSQGSRKAMQMAGNLKSMELGIIGKPEVDSVSTQEMFKSEQIKVKQLVENLH